MQKTRLLMRFPPASVGKTWEMAKGYRRSVRRYDRLVREALEFRIRTLLPEQYQDTYEEIQPVPMRSAGLQYRSEEHTSELQSQSNLVCRLLLEKKKKKKQKT